MHKIHNNSAKAKLKNATGKYIFVFLFLSNLYDKPHNSPGIAILNREIHAQFLLNYNSNKGTTISKGQFKYFRVSIL